MLVMANKDVWTFDAYEDQVEIEESVYLAGNDGPRRTLQIAIYGNAHKVMRVQWTSRSRPQRQPQRRRRPRPSATADDEPQLPLEAP